MSHPRMIAGGALLLAAVLAACGGGDDATAEELEAYFRGVESAKARYDEARAPSPYANRGPDDLVETLRLENPVLTGFADDLRALDAPSSLAGDHDLLIGLSDGRVALQEEIALKTEEAREARASLATAQGPTEDFTTLNEAARIEWGLAICTLQRRAAEADVAIELGCDSEQLLTLRAVTRRTVRLSTGADFCRRAETPGEEVDQQIATVMHVFNRLDQPIQLHRYVVAGQGELVATLEPREDSLQITYVGVGGIVTNEAGECLGAAFPVGPAGVNLLVEFVE